MKQHFVLTDRRSSNPGRPVTTRTFENTVAILGSVMEDPNLSTRALDIDRRTLMKILKKDLKQWPYRYLYYTLHQGHIAAANDRWLVLKSPKHSQALQYAEHACFVGSRYFMSDEWGMLD